MSTQQTIDFSAPKGGDTYDPEHDAIRLAGQAARVWRLMLDGRWRTLQEIREHVGGSESGISARLRDFRKLRFGANDVQRRRRGDPAAGIFEYRLLPSGRYRVHADG